MSLVCFGWVCLPPQIPRFFWSSPGAVSWNCGLRMPRTSPNKRVGFSEPRRPPGIWTLRRTGPPPDKLPQRTGPSPNQPLAGTGPPLDPTHTPTPTGARAGRKKFVCGVWCAEGFFFLSGKKVFSRGVANVRATGNDMEAQQIALRGDTS